MEFPHWSQKHLQGEENNFWYPEGRMDILAGHRSVEEGTPKGKAGAEQPVLRVQRSKFLESEEKKKAVYRVKIRKLCLL